MEKLTKDISDIILSEVNNISEKINGLNFLELLKANIIEKLKTLIGEEKFPLADIKNYENNINLKNSTITIQINYYTKSFSMTKRNIENDSLFIVFNQAANFDIFKDEKKFTNLILYQNSGLSIPKDTVVNSKFNKNLLLVAIIRKDNELALTN